MTDPIEGSAARDPSPADDTPGRTLIQPADAPRVLGAPPAIVSGPGNGNGNGSLRRGQWAARPRTGAGGGGGGGGGNSGSAKSDGAAGRLRGAAAGPPPRGSGGLDPLLMIAVAVVVVLVTGITIGSTMSRQSSTPTATTLADSAQDSATLVPLAGSPAPSAGTSTTSASTPAAPSPTGNPRTAHPTQTTTGAAVGSLTAKAPTIAPGPPQPIGSWGLHDGSGVTATDTAGHHNGVATNIAWVGGAAEFNGASSEITVPAQVVDTAPGQSFTVAASAYLGKDSAYATVVSQEGKVNAGFFLEYSKTDNRWAFARVSVDADNPTPYRALSSAPPALSTWTALVGVFDGTTDKLSLYVNGQLQGTATDPTPFATAGDLVIGRSIAGGGQSAWFPGLVTDVKVFNSALTAAQVRALSN